MKRKIYLSVMLLSLSMTSFCAIWTINASANEFTPVSIVIAVGDTVDFVIDSSHDALEVSQTTWDVNGTTPLIGGFEVPFGGGMVYPEHLDVGIHYYVCTAHAADGMKGTIVVLDPVGFVDYIQSQTSITVYPNPSNGKFQFVIEGSPIAKSSKIEIYNLQGQKIYQSAITNSKFDLDLSNQQSNAIYFVKFNIGHTILTKKIVIQ